jgi:hypothetical protein
MPTILKDPKYLETLKMSEDHFSQHKLPYEEIDLHFIDWLNENNLEIWYGEIFHCPANREVIIHIDSLDPPDSCKLNWAYGEENAVMYWYKDQNNSPVTVKTNPIGTGKYLIHENPNYKIIESTVLKNPTLVNIATAHSLTNHGIKDWWCVGITVKRKEDTDRINWANFTKILDKYVILEQNIN